MQRTFRFFLSLCALGALCGSVSAAEADCSAASSAASIKFVERGHSKAVSRVGSPLATLRHRLAQRALARAQLRAIIAEASATRQHASHSSHGTPTVMGEADCSTGEVTSLPPVPEEGK